MKTLVIPNRRPYNDLWLKGLIPFKTRMSFDKTFEANYGKTVYLYNSGRNDAHVMRAHGWTTADLTPAGHIVAKGILKPFVGLTQEEADEFERAVWNNGPNEDIWAATYKLDLDNLQAIGPIPFKWPNGPVKYTYTESTEVE